MTRPSGSPRRAGKDDAQSGCGDPDVDKDGPRFFDWPGSNRVGSGLSGEIKKPAKPVVYPG